jgi:hypothetical protein
MNQQQYTIKNAVVKKNKKKTISVSRYWFNIAHTGSKTVRHGCPHTIEAILNAVGSKMKEVDWSEAGEWTAFHLAIKYDVESLKVRSLRNKKLWPNLQLLKPTLSQEPFDFS